jgi:hypothetical protein
MKSFILPGIMEMEKLLQILLNQEQRIPMSMMKIPKMELIIQLLLSQPRNEKLQNLAYHNQFLSKNLPLLRE